jgi:predicted glutamine amidotransferase
MVVNLNPMAGILTTTALITNHVANENISENVVKAHVRHATALPVSFQN